MKRRASWSVGVAAVELFLHVPDFGTQHVGKALDWLFYVVLPNFCFFKALLDLGMKHQLTNICNKIDEKIDREMFCEALHVRNMTNLCCPGELNDDTTRVCLTNITAVSIANVQFVWMDY